MTSPQECRPWLQFTPENHGQGHRTVCFSDTVSFCQHRGVAYHCSARHVEAFPQSKLHAIGQYARNGRIFCESLTVSLKYGGVPSGVISRLVQSACTRLVCPEICHTN